MNNRSLISMLVEAIIFIAIIAWGTNYYREKMDNSEQNLIAYRDQIKNLELKNGELITSRNSYIVKYSELEDVLNISRKEINDLKKTLSSKVAYISKLESQISTGPIIIEKDSIVYIEKSQVESHFKYQDEWVNLSGITTINDLVGSTRFNNISMNVPLKVGLTNDYQIFVQSPNPYIMFNSIEGAVVDGSQLAPRKKKLSWGVQLGFGTMYDIIKKDVSIGPYGGLGIEINF